MNKNQEIGIAFIPGTFPTSKVKGMLQINAPATLWRRETINDIFNFYKDAVTKEKQKPYPNPGIVDYVSKKSGHDIGKVRLVLFAIATLVKDAKIKPYWLNFVKPETGVIRDIATKAAKPLEKYMSTMKWVAIAAVVGVGIYFTWPLLMKGRKKLKTR